MKVKDLLEKLSHLNPDSLIVLSSDSEGNCYDTLYSIEDGHYYNSNWKELVFLDEEDEESDFEQEDCIHSCTVLYP